MQQVLEREVDEKTQQLQTMATTLQKFKLELVNREQNYNKVFPEKRNMNATDFTARPEENAFSARLEYLGSRCQNTLGVGVRG